MHSQEPHQERWLRVRITNVDYKRKDPVFWIESSTNLPKYKLKKGRFPRYYSELEKLQRYLSATMDDAFIPPLPACPVPRYNKDGQLVQRQWWLTVALEIRHDEQGHCHDEDGTTLNDSHRPEFRIQRWLDRITKHARVRPSEAVREFVESEATMFRPQLKKKRQRLPSKIAIVHASESNMEPEFATWSEMLRLLHQCFEQLQLRADMVAQRHTEMALAWDRWTAGWIAYGSLERQPGLFILFKKIAKGSQQLLNLERSQGIATTETLGDEITFQVTSTHAAQGAMLRRLDALSDYLSSGRYTESCLRNAERLQSSVNIDRDRASEAIIDLENARLTERECSSRYKNIDESLRKDLQPKLKSEVTKDMVGAIREYAKSQLHLERQKLLVWQAIQRDQ